MAVPLETVNDSVRTVVTSVLSSTAAVMEWVPLATEILTTGALSRWCRREVQRRVGLVGSPRSSVGHFVGIGFDHDSLVARPRVGYF